MVLHPLVLLVISFLVGRSQIKSQCPSVNSDCLTSNPQPKDLIPLFHGRCCLKNNANCKFEERLTPGIIQNSGLQCGTGVELCSQVTEVDQNVYQDCYQTQVELPYKCCYIGFRYSRKCVPLDVSNTKIYRVFEAQFRALYGLAAEDKLKIECTSNTIKSISRLFLVLFLLLL